MAEPIPALLSRRYLAVSLTVFTMVSLSAFESLAVIAALPEIAGELGRVDLLPWVVTAYLVAATVAAVSAGPLIDSVGVRRIFLVGVTVFAVATTAAALAPSMETLIVTRLFHGAGGGLVFTTSLAAVPLSYPHAMVGRAYAAGATVWGVMAVAGPAIAALVLTVLDWRWIFLVILPLVALGIVLGLRTLPGAVAGAERTSFDLLGISLLAVFFVGLVLALDRLDRSSLILGAIATAAAFAYHRHAKNEPTPVVRIGHMFVDPYRGLWTAVGFVLLGGMGAYVFSPVYIRAARFGSEALTAWTVLYLTVGWTLGANISGRLQHRTPGDHLILAGVTVTGVSLLVNGSLVAATAPLWAIFAALTLIGVGLGLSTNAALQVLREATPDDTIGRATAAHDFGRNIGFTGGTAIGGAILLTVMTGRIADIDVVQSVLAGIDVAASNDVADAVAAGYRVLLLVGAGIAAAGLPFGLAVRRWRRRTAGII